MARTAELIHILRNTLIELEQAEHLDADSLEVKSSILRSIAEIENWAPTDSRKDKCRRALPEQ